MQVLIGSSISSNVIFFIIVLVFNASHNLLNDTSYIDKIELTQLLPNKS